MPDTHIPMQGAAVQDLGGAVPDPGAGVAAVNFGDQMLMLPGGTDATASSRRPMPFKILSVSVR